MAAYHLAFGPDGFLYVTGPSLSSFDSVMRISRTARLSAFSPGWAGRKVWRLIAKATSTSPQAAAATAAS